MLPLLPLLPWQKGYPVIGWLEGMEKSLPPEQVFLWVIFQVPGPVGVEVVVETYQEFGIIGTHFKFAGNLSIFRRNNVTSLVSLSSDSKNVIGRPVNVRFGFAGDFMDFLD